MLEIIYAYATFDDGDECKRVVKERRGEERRGREEERILGAALRECAANPKGTLHRTSFSLPFLVELGVRPASDVVPCSTLFLPLYLLRRNISHLCPVIAVLCSRLLLYHASTLCPVMWEPGLLPLFILLGHAYRTQSGLSQPASRPLPSPQLDQTETITVSRHPHHVVNIISNGCGQLYALLLINITSIVQTHGSDMKSFQHHGTIYP